MSVLRSSRRDFAKCQGMNCALRTACVRFMRPTDQYGQVWAEFWREMNQGRCDYQVTILVQNEPYVVFEGESC